MIGFKMDVNSSTLSESDIRDAQSAFSQTYQFGGFYTRGKGLRLFKTIGTDSYIINYLCTFIIIIV